MDVQEAHLKMFSFIIQFLLLFIQIIIQPIVKALHINFMLKIKIINGILHAYGVMVKQDIILRQIRMVTIV